MAAEIPNGFICPFQLFKQRGLTWDVNLDALEEGHRYFLCASGEAIGMVAINAFEQLVYPPHLRYSNFFQCYIATDIPKCHFLCAKFPYVREEAFKRIASWFGCKVHSKGGLMVCATPSAIDFTVRIPADQRILLVSREKSRLSTAQAENVVEEIKRFWCWLNSPRAREWMNSQETPAWLSAILASTPLHSSV